MKADSFLKFFVPKEHAFADLFGENSQNLLKAAILLHEMMLNSKAEDFERIYKEIKDVEHRGDDITRRTYEQLNKSFITSFDREDIHQLTAHIDDTVDLIDGISRRIVLYKPKKLIPVFIDISELILEAAKDIETAIRLLKHAESNKVRIMEVCSRINITEHKADDVYYSGASELFSNESDTKELIKISKILENLERCINEEERIANTIKTIIIKIF
jgi:predicted phosphate transport protein (TIGR00153 family)